MTDREIPSTSPPDGKVARRVGLALAGLVLAGCCFWSGLGAWLFAPLTPLWANRVDEVRGKVDLIVPAQSGATTGHLSPDGQQMILGWTRDGQEEWVVLNLTTNVSRPFARQTGALCWLNAEQFIVYDSASNRYYLVNAQDASIVYATRFPVDQSQQSQLRAAWRAAERMYILDTFSTSGYTVLTIEQGQPVIYRGFNTGRDSITIVDALTKDIPHVRIPDLCDRAPERTQIASPDGRYYAIVPNGSNPPVRVYTRDGQLVAQARKSGWFPIILGWASDSSGVYFQTKVNGSAASMLVPYQPIFKLSPLTPAEEQSALIWRIGMWAAGIGVVGGVGWWLWRRRRRRMER